MKAISYSPEALKALKRHANMAARIRAAVADYGSETGARANMVVKLVGSSASRLRVGDFRVIFEESDTELRVTRIAPRGTAYE